MLADAAIHGDGSDSAGPRFAREVTRRGRDYSRIRAHMLKTALACPLVLAIATLWRSQSPAPSNTAAQQARVDGQFKAWRTTVTQLLSRADVKALGLKPIEVEAYTAVILDGQPGARVDLADVARRMS